MLDHHSVRFFDAQFRRQREANDFALNPFEQLALPHVRGRVLDYGCGLGNLAVAAARRGCEVVALDASAEAVSHLAALAAADGLALHAEEADLRRHVLAGDYDTVVCIGLLMFFDCATAAAQLEQLKAHVRPGGTAIVNVLSEGTTYLGMFGPEGYCLFGRGELRERFAGWEILADVAHEFPAPGGTRKCFATLIARRPEAPLDGA
ncbi:MAG: methyltransferase domain-containing protein [Betaproteobacteria bacterium]|jgi:tellurite methyltransferase|nr:methyltransferase domain-containing protein [Betaproteobacteria bacterium]MCC6248592.1 methyltransferase domain-containing protein [Rubrivivax sp.]MCL4696009.1 methyltransferase domain-containing protein [Burkholderiaceae bacterium]